MADIRKVNFSVKAVLMEARKGARPGRQHLLWSEDGKEAVLIESGLEHFLFQANPFTLLCYTISILNERLQIPPNIFMHIPGGGYDRNFTDFFALIPGRHIWGFANRNLLVSTSPILCPRE